MSARALAVLAMATAMALAPAAARADEIANGSALLRIDRSLLLRMERSGVRLESPREGTLRAGTLRLPLDIGELAPSTAGGYAYVRGGIRFARGRHKSSITQLILNTEDRLAYGSVDARNPTVATLPPPRMRAPLGWDTRFVLRSMPLTGAAARGLNRALGVRDVFRPGGSLASVAVRAHPATVTAVGGSLSFSFAAPFLAKLESLDLSVAPLGSASIEAGPPLKLTLPIDRGSVAPLFRQGEILSRSGFALRQAGTQQPTRIAYSQVAFSPGGGLLSSSPRVVPTPSTSVSPRLFSVAFKGAAIVSDPAAHSVFAPPSPATLQAAGAAGLNQVLAAPRGSPTAFTAGESVGVVSVEVATR